MVSWWIIGGLILSAVAVSFLGAAFSVVGIAALFSGAAASVIAMASALEFAKFVLAAYLHRRWTVLNWLFKSYLTISVVVLSLITSMGIFGFLSDAYSSASAVLEEETIKSDALKKQKNNLLAEVQRLNSSVDEIPANRITRRLQLRAEIEPVIADLIKRSNELDSKITESELKILDVKKKVGPLIYIARVFNMDLDTVVKYLIFVFVFVFDPLAICLVIAVSEALQQRQAPTASATTRPQQTIVNMRPVAKPPQQEAG